MHISVSSHVRLIYGFYPHSLSPIPILFLTAADADPEKVRQYGVGFYKSVGISSVCGGWSSTEFPFNHALTPDWEVHTSQHGPSWHAPGALSPALLSTLIALWEEKRMDRQNMLVPSNFFTFPAGVPKKNRHRQIVLSSEDVRVMNVYETLRPVVENIIGIPLKKGDPTDPTFHLAAHLLEYRMHTNGAMENVGKHFDIRGDLAARCDEFTATLTLKGSGFVHYPSLHPPPSVPSANVTCICPDVDTPYSVLCQPLDIEVHENNDQSVHFTTNLPPYRLISAFHFFATS